MYYLVQYMQVINSIVNEIKMYVYKHNYETIATMSKK